MDKFGLAATSAGFFAIAGAMIFYEWYRARNGRRMVPEAGPVELYYMTYLTALTMGTCFALVVVIR